MPSTLWRLGIAALDTAIRPWATDPVDRLVTVPSGLNALLSVLQRSGRMLSPPFIHERPLGYRVPSAHDHHSIKLISGHQLILSTRPSRSIKSERSAIHPVIVPMTKVSFMVREMQGVRRDAANDRGQLKRAVSTD